MVAYWSMRTWTAVILCVPLVGIFAARAVSAPRVGSVPTAWTLDVKFLDPQRLSLRLPGDREPTTFWYLLYEVTNSTGRDVDFYPSVRLVTNTLQVVEGGAEIPPSVYDVVAGRHKNEFPFLAPPTRVTGRLLQGRQNARSSVAVFRMFDKEANSFTIYASGFSGELKRIPNPAFRTGKEYSTDAARYFILRRTLAIRYDLPGAAETRWQAKPVRKTREWVMR